MKDKFFRISYGTPSNFLKPVAMIIVAFSLLFFCSYENAQNSIGTLDFIQYWSAYKLYSSQSNPYNVELLYEMQRGLWPSVLPIAIICYCPPIVLPLLKFAALFNSFTLSAALWNATSILVLMMTSILFFKFIASDQACSFNKFVKLKIVILLLSFVPSYALLYYGQVSFMLLLGLYAFIIVSLRRDSISKYLKLFMGVVFTFSIIKPHIFLLIYIYTVLSSVRNKDYWFLTGFILGNLTLLSISFSTNAAVFFEYFEFIKNVPDWKTPTLGYWIGEYFLDHDYLSKGIVPVIAALVFSLCYIRKNIYNFFGFRFQILEKFFSKFSEEDLIFVTVLLSIITCAYCWLFDFVLIIPVLIYLFVKSDADRMLYSVLLAANMLMLLTPKELGQEYFVWYPCAVLIIYTFYLSQRNSADD